MTLNTVFVEDRSTVRETLIPAMRAFGNPKVTATAETAEDALAAIAKNPAWQVLVVDLFLRRGSGLEVVRAAMSRSDKQKVIVLSNYATAQIRDHCAGLRVDAVFDKSTGLDAFFEYCLSPPN
jgi:DNA-binding NarL/FixJ family response regulator